MTWFCDACNRNYADGSVRAHLKTKKHQDNLATVQIHLTPPIQNMERGIGSYVDKLFQKAERARRLEEYKFTPLFERSFYVRGLPIQNFGPQHTFTIAEVNSLVSEQIGTQNIGFPFNL